MPPRRTVGPTEFLRYQLLAQNLHQLLVLLDQCKKIPTPSSRRMGAMRHGSGGVKVGSPRENGRGEVVAVRVGMTVGSVIESLKLLVSGTTATNIAYTAVILRTRFAKGTLEVVAIGMELAQPCLEITQSIGDLVNACAIPLLLARVAVRSLAA